MQGDNVMFVCFQRDQRVLQYQFGSKPTDTHKVQLRSQLVDGKTKLGGVEFVQVKATIEDATTHRDACSRSTLLVQLKKQFKTYKGYFVVNLCSTELNLNFFGRKCLILPIAFTSSVLPSRPRGITVTSSTRRYHFRRVHEYHLSRAGTRHSCFILIQ